MQESGQKIETTKQKSVRLNKKVYDIHHEVNWSFVLDIDKDWIFNK